MKARNLLVLLILVAATLFAALNWAVFSQSTKLNLVAAQIEAPLGLLMLGLVALLSVVYLALLARLETASLLDGRRTTKELDRARRLAESSEESRLKSLRVLMETEFEQVHAELAKIIEQGRVKSPRRAIGDENDDAEPESERRITDDA